MKKRNYNLPASYWEVTQRTKRAEASYKGWRNPPKKPIQPQQYKPRWISRLNPKEEE